MYKIENVADYFLALESMSFGKLQKLVYYAYAWSAALLNEDADDLSFRLFNDRFEAWIHGPTVPKLYYIYRSYEGYDIPQNDSFNPDIFSTEVRDILNQVWNVYGQYTHTQLELMVHREDPWLNARGKLAPWQASVSPISDYDMFVYYNELANRRV